MQTMAANSKEPDPFNVSSDVVNNVPENRWFRGNTVNILFGDQQNNSTSVQHSVSRSDEHTGAAISSRKIESTAPRQTPADIAEFLQPDDPILLTEWRRDDLQLDFPGSRDFEHFLQNTTEITSKLPHDILNYLQELEFRV